MAIYRDAVTEALNISEMLKPAYLANFKAAMDTVAPGASAQVGANIAAMLKGELPKDVMDRLKSASAELNIKQGRFGEAASYRTARDIGKTSLDLIGTGTNMLQGLMPKMPDINTLISGALSGKEFDANLAIQAAGLGEKAREFDVGALLDKSRLDLDKYRTEVANTQFKANLEAQLATQREKSAMEKFQLTLAANQADAALKERRYEFDTNAQMDKMISEWNKKFESFALGEKLRMAQTLTAQKEDVASKKADTFTKTTVGGGATQTPAFFTAPGTPDQVQTHSSMASVVSGKQSESKGDVLKPGFLSTQDMGDVLWRNPEYSGENYPGNIDFATT